MIENEKLKSKLANRFDAVPNIILLEKKKINTEMNFKLTESNSKEEMKMELSKFRKYLVDIKDIINSDKCLSKIFDDKDFEGFEREFDKDMTDFDKDLIDFDKDKINFDKDTGTELRTDKYSTSLRLSKERIGRYVWSILHTMASAYPLKADHIHQKAIKHFIEQM